MSGSPHSEEPVPFADDPSGDPRMREIFGAARRDLPRINAPRIAAIALAPALGLKLGGFGLGLGIVVLIAIGATFVMGRSPSAPSAPSVAASAALGGREPQHPVIVSAPRAADSRPTGHERPLEARARPGLAPQRRSERAARDPSPPEASVAPAALERVAEGALLLRARRALAAGEPERALSAIRAHEEQFPDGPLTPEREAIAIDALSSTAQGELARARARRFLARWPDSPYAHRAVRALAGAPSAAP